MSNNQQGETAFLRQCLRYDESAASRQLEERIAQIQCNGRCLNRARWLVAFLAALAVAGLGYVAIFRDRFPDQAFVFTTQFITDAISAVCLGSLISLLAFSSLGVIYGRQLNRLREEGRLSVARFLESRLGQPRATNQNGHSKDQVIIVPNSETAAPVAERGPEGSAIPGLPGRAL